MTDMEITPQTLKDFRQRHSLTMTAAAKMAGVHLPDWSKWERGKSEPKNGSLDKLIRLFELEKEPTVGPDSESGVSHDFTMNSDGYVIEKPATNLPDPLGTIKSRSRVESVGEAFNGISVLTEDVHKAVFVEVQEFKDGGFLAIDSKRNYYTVYPLD